MTRKFRDRVIDTCSVGGVRLSPTCHLPTSGFASADSPLPGCSHLHSPAGASSFQQHSTAHFSQNVAASSPTCSYHFLLCSGSSRATQASPSCCSCISPQRQGCVALRGPLGEINNVSTQETHCLPSGSVFCCPPEQTTERPLCRLSTARPYLSPAASDSVIWRWDAL